MVAGGAVVAVAAVALSACASTSTPKPQPGLPRYDTARAAFSCTLTGDGSGMAIRVPGQGRRAAVRDLIVRVDYPGGVGQVDKVIAVPHGVVPAGGLTIRWQAPPASAQLGHGCRVTGSLG